MLRQRLTARRRALSMGIVVAAAAAVSSVTTPASALPPPGGVAWEGAYAANGYIDTNDPAPGPALAVSWTDPGGSVVAKGRFTDATDTIIAGGTCGEFLGLAPDGDGTTGHFNPSCYAAAAALQDADGGFEVRWQVAWSADGVTYGAFSSASILLDTLAPASVSIDDSAVTAGKVSTPEAVAGTPISWEVDDADNSVALTVRNDPGVPPAACDYTPQVAGPVTGGVTPACYAALADGTIVAETSGTDVAGNPASASGSTDLDRVGSAAPAVSIDVANVTAANQASVPITVTGALDPAGTLTLSDTALNSVAAPLDLATNLGSQTVNLDATTLVDGTLTATAVLIDIDGNPSAPGIDTVLMDTTGPAAPVITSPAPGQMVGGGLACQGTPPSSGCVRIDGTGEAGSTVQLYDGATPLLVTPVTVGGTGSWTATVNYDTSGTKSIAAQGIDGLGNIGPLSALRIFDVDVVRPTASIGTPFEIGTCTLSCIVTGTASDDFAGLSAVQYDLYNVTGAVIQQGTMTCVPACSSTAPAPLEVTYSKTLTLLPGVYVLHVFPRDRAGLRASPPARSLFVAHP